MRKVSVFVITIVAAAVVAGALVIGANKFAQAAPKREAVKLFHKWEKENLTGGDGRRFCRKPELASWPFAVRSCRILRVHDNTAYGDSKSASLWVRIESSNKGGVPITSDWIFFMSDQATVGKSTYLSPSNSHSNPIFCAAAQIVRMRNANAVEMRIAYDGRKVKL